MQLSSYIHKNDINVVIKSISKSCFRTNKKNKDYCLGGFRAISLSVVGLFDNVCEQKLYQPMALAMAMHEAVNGRWVPLKFASNN